MRFNSAEPIRILAMKTSKDISHHRTLDRADQPKKHHAHRHGNREVPEVQSEAHVGMDFADEVWNLHRLRNHADDEQSHRNRKYAEKPRATELREFPAVWREVHRGNARRERHGSAENPDERKEFRERTSTKFGGTRVKPRFISEYRRVDTRE